jgi:hypothetical protein
MEWVAAPAEMGFLAGDLAAGLAIWLGYPDAEWAVLCGQEPGPAFGVGELVDEFEAAGAPAD